MKIVIAGLGTGGLFSAIAARKENKNAEIVIIDKKDFEILHSCGIPYLIEGKIKAPDSLKEKMPDINAQKILKHEIIGLVPSQKKVLVKDITNGKKSEVYYDKLILSVGTDARIPDINGIKEHLGKSAFKIDSYEDAVKLADKINKAKKTGKKKLKAIVIGAGAIGIESAYAMRKKGIDVTIVEMLSTILPGILDNDMSATVKEYLENAGIRILLDSGISELYNKDKLKGAIITGSKHECDIIVIAAGRKTNSELFIKAGISFGANGIIVNDLMQTCHKDIYAIGDIIGIKSLIDGRNSRMQLATAAYKQGFVAGTNAAGGKKVYKGGLCSFITRIGGLEIAATGFNAHTAGEQIVIGKATGTTKPEWCGNSRNEITVKIIVDRKTQRIVGGQAIGYEGCAHRIDIINAAIKGKLTVYDLSETEMCYCPAVSDVYDVLMQAADNAIRKIERV
jgi:NADH oxidase (H2O2-forming)